MSHAPVGPPGNYHVVEPTHTVGMVSAGQITTGHNNVYLGIYDETPDWLRPTPTPALIAAHKERLKWRRVGALICLASAALTIALIVWAVRAL